MTIHRQNGFTLIELIFSMVLLGIVGGFGGLFVVQALESYTLARSSAERTQKAQSALARLTLELENMTGIGSYSQGGGSMTYTTRINSGDPDIARSINLVNGRVKIIDGSTLPTQNTGGTLIDGVLQFQIRYQGISESGVLSTWGGILKDLYAIEIQLVLNGTGSYASPAAFSATITPRRSGHWDGPFAWNR